MNFRVYLYFMGVTLLWGLSPLLLSTLSVVFDYPQILVTTSFFAALTHAVVLTVQGRWGEFRVFKPKDYRTLFLTGAFAMAPCSLLLYKGYHLSPHTPGEINIMNYLWPIWFVVLSVFILHDKFTVRKGLGVLLAFAGACIVILRGKLSGFGQGEIAAYLFAGGGAFFWGLYSALSRKYQYPSQPAMFSYTFSALIFYSVFACFFGGFIQPTFHQWTLLFLQGALLNGIGFLLWLMAVKYGDTGRLGSMAYITPVISLCFLHLAGREHLKPSLLFAIGLVALGVIIQHRGPKLPKRI